MTSSFPRTVGLTVILAATLLCTEDPLKTGSGSWRCGLRKFHLMLESVSVSQCNVTVVPALAVMLVRVVERIAAATV